MLSDIELIRLRRAQNILDEAALTRFGNELEGMKALLCGCIDPERAAAVVKKMNLKVQARALVDSDRILTGRHPRYDF